ncbi:hypothetical protein GN956_G26272 [Arapaima gigas]
MCGEPILPSLLGSRFNHGLDRHLSEGVKMPKEKKRGPLGIKGVFKGPLPGIGETSFASKDAKEEGKQTCCRRRRSGT